MSSQIQYIYNEYSYVVDSASIQQANPHFVIVDYTSSVSVVAGQSFTISAIIRNDGNASGTAMVRLIDNNGNIVDTKEITLNPNDTGHVSLVATAPSTPGRYTYRIEVFNEQTNNVDDFGNISVNVSEKTTVKGTNIITNIILIVLALIVLTTILSPRRR